MEQESETVALGRLLDETADPREKKGYELDVDAPPPVAPGVRLVGKIDHANLRDGVLHEVKRGRSGADAHRAQVRFYLWLLRLARVTRADGSEFTGQIDYPSLRRTEAVTLTDADAEDLAATVSALAALARTATPPPRHARRAFCAACAFEELCYG